MFWRRQRDGKRRRGTNAYHLLACLLLLASGGCLADAHQLQMSRLLDNLVFARAALLEEPPRIDAACDTVGDVQSRLLGEPGLSDVRPAWPALHEAADALLAVCGQQRLLEQPFEPTAAMLAARARWQEGVGSGLVASCSKLRDAARALGRPLPCVA